MSEDKSNIYEFGGFRLDVGRRLLLRRDDGQPLKVTSKAFDTLLYMVRHGGTVMDKDELMRAVWPDTVVEENNLSQNVSALRRALGEKQGENRYIVTVPGRGFTFVASVTTLTDGSPTGIEGEPEESRGEEVSNFTGAARYQSAWNRSRLMILAGLIITALGAPAIYLWRVRTKTVPTAPARTVAVLPFKPIVEENRDEALEMGMADTLIVRLSNLGGLNIRPFSSVRKFSGLEQDSMEAGRELGVESVLDGQIQRWGDRIRVTARLIAVGDGKQLWADQFDEKFTDIFTVQDLISEKVTSALALKLTGEEQRQLTRHYTENAEAYRMYIYGRFYRSKRTEAAFKMAIENFEEAIAKDPNYALAYAGLSETYIGLSVFGAMSPKEVFPKAREAALRALEIDDDIAESHVALAHFKAQSDRDWSGAERDYQRAIDLNPVYADAYRLYAIHLMEAGREDEALSRINRALEIDPTSAPFNATFGFIYYWARRYDQAIEQLRRSIDLEPGHWLAHYWLAQVYAQKGMYDEASVEAQKARDLSGDSGSSWVLGYVYAMAGRRAEAHQQLNELLNLSKQRYVPPYDIAQIYAALGDKDQAFAWLEKADEGRSRGMDFLKVNPAFDTLRSDARFVALSKRLGRE